MVHDYTENVEGLVAFRGSKYVQSRIENSFKEVERFLKAGRKVLFSGTPCQVAGLKRLLRKEYDNLLTVDFICHGVPSPGVWREYLKEETARQCGGKNSVLLSEPLDKNIFMRGFLADLYLRPSCYACPAKSFKSGSDITIGDFWGVQAIAPDLDDDKGISVMFIHQSNKFDLACLEKTKLESYSQYSIEKSSKKDRKMDLLLGLTGRRIY